MSVFNFLLTIRGIDWVARIYDCDITLIYVYVQFKVNSVFQHFKDYIEESFQEIKKSVFDRTKNFDDDFKNCKQNDPLKLPSQNT